MTRIATMIPPAILGRFQSLGGRQKLLTTIIPLGLVVGVLVFLNVGLRSSLGPDEAFDSFDMPYSQTFDEVAVNRWFQHSGTWVLQRGTLVQSAEDVQSAKIFVPKWLEVGTPYRLSIDIRMGEGARAAGLNFNAQYPEIDAKHHRVYLVREEGQLELVAGYIDSEGEFQTQTRMPVTQVADSFMLEIVVEEEVYNVRINGQPVLENRPLVYQDGLVGLYAADGPVVFDSLSLVELEDTYIAGAAVTDPIDSPVPNSNGLLYTSNFAGSTGSTGWAPFSGEWRIDTGYLSQFDPNGYDFGVGYENQSFDTATIRASFKHLSGQGAGVLFHMPSPYQLAGAHMVRYSERSDNLLWGYFDDTGTFNNQGYAPVDSPGETEHVLTIKVSEASYSITLDGEPVVGSVPLMSESGHIGLVTARSTAAFSMVEVTNLTDSGASQNPVAAAEASAVSPAEAQPPVSDSDVNPTAPAARPGAAESRVGYSVGGSLASSVTDNSWLPFAGEWVTENGELRQVAANGFDLATGYAGATFQDYALQVTLRHLEGQGGGVLFNMAGANVLEGAHMVRYSDTADGVFWGYYDETGKFIGQGYARVAPAGTDAHTITVRSSGPSYDLTLDGQLLARNVPLNRDSGHIGLITSQSSVAYYDIDISDAASAVTTAPSSTVQGTSTSAAGITATVTTQPPVASDQSVQTTNEDFLPLSGDWEREGTTVRQLNSAVYDFINSTDTFASNYSLEVDVTVPDDPALVDAGGGVIFHLPDRNKRNEGHMVRLVGTNEVLWGYYDATGAFVGQGRAELPEAGQSRTLQVKVQEGKYDLLIDGEIVAPAIPLKTSEGWIGLLAHRGPITFDNIRITLGN